MLITVSALLMIIVATNIETNKEIKRMELVYIPSGESWIGSGEWDHEYNQNEISEHKVYLNSFWISKTEITNSMYAECVGAGVCTYHVSHETNPRFLDPTYADHPVVYVTWQDAMDYCTWVGGRLPTEAEWEKAARGTDKRKYPWKEGYPTEKNVNAGNVIGDTVPVGLYRNGASPYGVLDMVGNVREWVANWYDDEQTVKVLKGGSFEDSYEHMRVADRLFHDPNSAGFNRGFRCMIPEQQ